MEVRTFVDNVAVSLPIVFSNSKFTPIAVTSYNIGQAGNITVVQSYPYPDTTAAFGIKIAGTGGSVSRDFYWLAVGK